MWISDPPRVSGDLQRDIRRRLQRDPRAWHECQEGSGDPVAEIRLTLLGLTSVVGLEYVDIIDELARDARHAAAHAQRAMDALLRAPLRDDEKQATRDDYIAEEREQRDHFAHQADALETCATKLRGAFHPLAPEKKT